MGRIQYIFVDYENVHTVDFDLLAGKPVLVELILGEQHKKLPVETVERLMKYPQQVKLVKAGKSGRNALDFVLAYRLGLASAADPKGHFHIVSGDTGFDALILYLRQHQIRARRDETFAKAFAPEAPPADRTQFVLEKLTKNKTNRPKRKKTLLSQINSYFGKKLTETDLENILRTLIEKHVIEIGKKGEVSYKV